MGCSDSVPKGDRVRPQYDTFLCSLCVHVHPLYIGGLHVSGGLVSVLDNLVCHRIDDRAQTDEKEVSVFDE